MPILEEYFAWLKTVHPEKGSKLEEAVRYSLNQEQALCAYLEHGEVSISNSLAENAKANGTEPFAYLQHVLVELKNSDAYTNTYLN